MEGTQPMFGAVLEEAAAAELLVLIGALCAVLVPPRF
jgi:hypothetical protein